ncbi:MAG: hypothetical protein Q8M07_02620 [Prosthecobacter sp.]|nr:hypothetical protein [Prosthecobacter sp.]
MTPVIYIITAPQELGHDLNAAALADALGCTSLVPEWDGVAPVAPGACAFVSAHHTPPANSYAITLRDLAELRQMTGDLYDLEIDPPHITHDLLRVLHGNGGGRIYRQLGEYVHHLRQRVIEAERRQYAAERIHEELTGIDYNNEGATDHAA